MSGQDNKAKQVGRYYRALYRAWGPQHWWPAETRFEVIVGAYLTQNTAWTNVERALDNLRAAHVLSVKGIRKIPLGELERLIQPSGYFRQKADRLKTFVAFLDQHYGGSLRKLFSQPTEKLREELLALNGIGPETADSILLYAGNHPVFVVDAYTRRVLDRHGILPERADYEEIRELFQRALRPLARRPQGREPNAEPARTRSLGPLVQARAVGMTPGELASGLPGASHPPSAMSMATRTSLVQVYNEMHGLLVGVGKHFCGKSQPKCDGCPLQRFLPRAK